jgi:hypothetical protein
MLSTFSICTDFIVYSSYMAKNVAHIIVDILNVSNLIIASTRTLKGFS